MSTNPTMVTEPALEPLDIARLEERRQACSVGEIAREREPIAGGVMAFEGPGSWANQASGLGLHGPVGAADLDRLTAWYNARGVGGRVLVATPAHESLLAGLGERGFRLAHFENVYAIERAAAARADEGLVWPEGVRVRRVRPDDDAGVREFAEVMTGGGGPRLQPDGGLRPMSVEELDLMRRVVEHPRTHAFAAEAEGRFVAVAGGEVFGEGGSCTACLFGAVTVPEFRRRGVQGALIRYRTAAFARLGARVVIVQTRPGIATERSARRQGFTLAYAKAVMKRDDPA